MTRLHENDVFYYPTCQLESHIFSTEVWDWIPLFLSKTLAKQTDGTIVRTDGSNGISH